MLRYRRGEASQGRRPRRRHGAAQRGRRSRARRAASRSSCSGQGLRGEEGLARRWSASRPAASTSRAATSASALLLEIGDISREQAQRPHPRRQELRGRARRAPRRPQDPHQADAALQRGEGLDKLVEVVLKLAASRRRPEAEGEVPAHRRDRHRAPDRRPRQARSSSTTQVLELDPRFDKALDRGDRDRASDKAITRAWSACSSVELERATERGDNAEMLESFEQLGVLYKDKLGWMGEAIDAYEAAQTLEPGQRASATSCLRQPLRQRSRRSTWTRPWRRRPILLRRTPTSPTRTSRCASSTPRPSAPTRRGASARRSSA